MPQLFAGTAASSPDPLIVPINLVLQNWRTNDPASLTARIRAYIAAQLLIDPAIVLESLRASGVNAGPTWDVQAVSTIRPPPIQTAVTVPFLSLDVAFRVTADAEPNINGQVQSAIAEIQARHPADEIDLHELIVAGAGDGNAWLIGVVCQFIPIL